MSSADPRCICEGPAKIGPGYHRPDCPVSRTSNPNVSAPEILRELIEWDRRWPKNQTYNKVGYDRCHVELDRIIAGAQAALAAHETTVAPTPLEYNVGEDGWMACDHCDAEVVEALKCTGCGATSIARPQSKTSAKPVQPAGPWEHRWYGSGNDQGDHIFQNGERIAYLGNHHHYDVTRLVYEHNVAVAAVKTAGEPT